MCNILALLGVAGDPNVFLFLEILLLFCIHFLKTKKELIWLPFLERRKGENKDIPLFFDQYPGTPRCCRKRQRFSLPRNTHLVLHPFPKNQKDGVNLPFLKSRKAEKKDIPLFFVQYHGTPRSCRICQRSSLPRNTPFVLLEESACCWRKKAAVVVLHLVKDPEDYRHVDSVLQGHRLLGPCNTCLHLAKHWA